MRKLLLLTVAFLTVTAAFAGGYRVSLQGQKSLAMGHTGVAVVNSSETVFFNPAAMVFMEDKFNITAGVTGVFSNIIYQNEDTGAYAESDNPMGTPFYLYASYKANDWLSFGLGVYTPYGSTVQYDEGWVGSHLVDRIKLMAIYIQPSVAFKIHEKISIGGGPIYAMGSVEFDKSLNRTLADIDGNRSTVEVKATGVTAWGWVASAMFEMTDDLRIGATYRSKIDMDADDGTAKFHNVPNSPLTPFEDSAIEAGLPMPAELTVGASYNINKWTFAFDFNRTFWDVYESLDITFENPAVPDSQSARNYKNSSNYRFGVQYDVTQMFTLRAGYYYDETPVRAGYFAPETPRNSSDNFTAGLTFNVSPSFQIDAAFAYTHMKQVNASYDYYFEDGFAVPFSGTYKTNAFIPGIGITYKL